MNIERPPAELTLSDTELIEAVQAYVLRKLETAARPAPKIQHLVKIQLQTRQRLGDAYETLAGTLTFTLKSESEQP